MKRVDFDFVEMLNWAGEHSSGQESSSVSKGAIESAWIDESLRRLDAYQRGEMSAYPVEDVIADLVR